MPRSLQRRYVTIWQKNPESNCDISANEIESEDKEVILYTTNNNSDNDSYPTDSSKGEEEIVNMHTAEQVEDNGIERTYNCD